MPATVHSSESESTAPAAGTSWTDLAASMFSFPVMCMFLLAAAIFGFSVKQIAEPDIWWHLRNAAYLFLHHSFPSVDSYSFGAAGSPWLNHEWLSEIPLYLGFKTMGLRGMLAALRPFAPICLAYRPVLLTVTRPGRLRVRR